jgi:hypothetical protein
MQQLFTLTTVKKYLSHLLPVFERSDPDPYQPASLFSAALGEVLHGTIRHLLSVAYELLDREAFATILQVKKKLQLTYQIFNMS